MPDLTSVPPGRPYSGLFVVFEGGDGAGKSTQMEHAREFLSSVGFEVVTTREPGGTPLGSKIRELLLHGDDIAARAEALLYAADRAHHVETVVRPALERGAVVLQDRFMDSSIAYQGAGRDLAAADVEGISRWATGGLVPDLTVLLDIDPALGRARRGDRGGEDRLEREADDFHMRVREHFLALAGSDSCRYLVVRADLPRGTISERIAARLRRELRQHDMGGQV